MEGILIRYGLMALVSRETFARAAFFPPVLGRERIALYVDQVTLLILFGFPPFLRVTLDTATHWIGLIVYVAEIVLYAKSVIDFSRPLTSGMNSRGLYKYSRNPMYVAFFLYLLGCGLLVGSWIYLAVLLVFQVSVHYVISRRKDGVSSSLERLTEDTCVESGDTSSRGAKRSVENG